MSPRRRTRSVARAPRRRRAPGVYSGAARRRGLSPIRKRWWLLLLIVAAALVAGLVARTSAKEDSSASHPDEVTVIDGRRQLLRSSAKQWLDAGRARRPPGFAPVPRYS